VRSIDLRGKEYREFQGQRRFWMTIQENRLTLDQVAAMLSSHFFIFFDWSRGTVAATMI